MLYSKASEALSKFAARLAFRCVKHRLAKARCPLIIRSNSARSASLALQAPIFAAREADLIIGIGTRYSDFTSASKTAFQNPSVRFININVAEFDAYKHAALALTGDALVTIDELQLALGDYRVEDNYRDKIQQLRSRVGSGS